MAWLGMAWHGLALHGGMAWQLGMAGMAWHSMVPHAWHGMACRVYLEESGMHV